MEPGQPDVLAQVPAGGAVGKPASGTYGETAALDRLKAALPISPQGQAPPGGQAPPPPMPTPGTAAAPAAPPGIPDVLMAPTNQPGTPVGTPLAMPAPMPPDASAQRLLLLNQLVESQDDSVREWATAVRNRLIRSGRA